MDHSTHDNHAHAHQGHIPEWSDLSWIDLWSPWVMIMLVIVFILYMLYTGRWRTKLAKDAPLTSIWRRTSFALGLLLIYTASGSPIAIMGHDYMFSAHMLQQSLLYLAVPPLILIGLPSWWFAPIANKRATQILLKIIQHPIFALFNFNIFFSFYHIPFIFDEMTTNHWFHLGYHIWLQFCAIQMWLLIINPIPSPQRLRPLQKIGYIFANGVLLTPACALIIFADHVLYQTYAQTPVVFEIFSKLDDQQLGGVIMKLMQEAVYGLALGTIFYRWFYSERAKERAQTSNSTA